MISADHIVPDRAPQPAAPLRRRRCGGGSNAASGLLVHAGAARSQPAGHRRAPPRGGRRRVRRRQRARRPAKRAPGPRIVDRLPGLRRERDARATSTPRRCAAPATACACGPSAGCGRRRSRRCALAGSTCGPATAGRCSSYLGGSTLQRALARIGAEPLRAHRGTGPQRVRDEARASHAQLGISKLSDLARYWSGDGAGRRARGPPREPRQDEQWAVAPRQRARPARRVGADPRRRRRPSAIVDTGAQARAPRPRAEHLDQLRRDPRQRRRRRRQRLRRRRPRRRSVLHAAPARTSTTDTGTARTSPGSSPPRRTARGVVGVAPQAKLMIVKVLDDDGRGHHRAPSPRASATPPPTARG